MQSELVASRQCERQRRGVGPIILQTGARTSDLPDVELRAISRSGPVRNAQSLPRFFEGVHSVPGVQMPGRRRIGFALTPVGHWALGEWEDNEPIKADVYIMSVSFACS